MDRAIVLVGVQRTGGLPVLPAVADSIAALRSWASWQGFPDDRIVEITDLDGSVVTPDAVFTAVSSLLSIQTLEQLIVYFCGHGIVINRNEFWLLSAAPANPNAAINVARSSELAATGTVPHVVFVSDACRTAATTITAQTITGSVIMPNLGINGPFRSVDQFYPCLLGEPAFEVQNAEDATKYHAIFTEALTSALRGDVPGASEVAMEAGQEVLVIRPRLLADVLPDLVTDRALQLGAPLSVNQRPDARITSDGRSAWLAQLPGTVLDELPGPLPEGPFGTRPAFRDAGIRRHLSAAEDLARRAADQLLDDGLPPRTGPPGILTRGAAAEIELLADDLAAVRFDFGAVAFLPVPDAGHCIVTVENDQLVDIELRVGEPGPDPLWRAEVAARSRIGLPVEVPTTGPVADPYLAVYLAYALADAGRRREIVDLSGDDALFDVSLLLAEDSTTRPRYPLLARGWALWDAPIAVRPLPSVWTIFDSSSEDQVRHLAEGW